MNACREMTDDHAACEDLDALLASSRTAAGREHLLAAGTLAALASRLPQLSQERYGAALHTCPVLLMKRRTCLTPWFLMAVWQHCLQTARRNMHRQQPQHTS
jgi:hypothetical protein